MSGQFDDIAQGLLAIALWIAQTSFAPGSALLFVAVVDERVGVLVGMLRVGRPG